MNNVTQFPSSVDYPELNIAALRNASRSAGDAGTEVKRLFIQTDYLPALHSRVTSVDTAIRLAHLKLREVVESIGIKLAINTTTLRGYQAELKSSVGADRQDILEDITALTSKITQWLSKDQNSLKNLLAPMNQAVNRADTSQYLKQLADDKERIPTEILEIQSRIEALEQKRNTLTDAMALIEAKGFTAVGKDTLLNAQEIAKLGIAGPEVAVVDKAIELTQQVLEKVEKLVDYFNLVDARNTIRKQLDDLVIKTHGKTTALRLIGMKSDLITHSHTFDEQRLLYIGEFEKILASNQSFLRVYPTVDADNELAVTQFVVDAIKLASHLKVVI